MPKFKDSEEYKAHKEIGFPTLSVMDQYKYLLLRDYQVITKLVDVHSSHRFHYELIGYYITMNYSAIRSCMQSNRWLQDECVRSETYINSEGSHLKETNGLFKIYHYEKGHLMGVERVGGYGEALDYYANMYAEQVKRSTAEAILEEGGVPANQSAPKLTTQAKGAPPPPAKKVRLPPGKRETPTAKSEKILLMNAQQQSPTPPNQDISFSADRNTRLVITGEHLEVRIKKAKVFREPIPRIRDISITTAYTPGEKSAWDRFFDKGYRQLSVSYENNDSLWSCPLEDSGGEMEEPDSSGFQAFVIDFLAIKESFVAVSPGTKVANPTSAGQTSNSVTPVEEPDHEESPEQPGHNTHLGLPEITYPFPVGGVNPFDSKHPAKKYFIFASGFSYAVDNTDGFTRNLLHKSVPMGYKTLFVCERLDIAMPWKLKNPLNALADLIGENLSGDSFMLFTNVQRVAYLSGGEKISTYTISKSGQDLSARGCTWTSYSSALLSARKISSLEHVSVLVCRVIESHSWH